MNRIVLTAPVAAALVLTACDSPDVTQEPAAPAAAQDTPDLGASPTPSSMPSMVPPISGTAGVNDGDPDLTPPVLTSEAERGEKGARNVLLSWARAIELREYDQAWDLFGASGKERMSRAEFARIFAGLDDITVAVPGGSMEGAAGSSYYTSQATITAEDADGRPVRFEGPVVLRRVNDVPGATAAQLRWHVESADLDWTH